MFVGAGVGAARKRGVLQARAARRQRALLNSARALCTHSRRLRHKSMLSRVVPEVVMTLMMRVVIVTSNLHWANVEDLKSKALNLKYDCGFALRARADTEAFPRVITNALF
ncbi:hypothetical protein EVAR_6482_1 [Eumeta japonica]|uniref:Uncharacterized protein n=1 Tax=Eumeta variegata TaxID=151549 RepID=A0A4C1SQK6_EUMVA|nr:hypothetical protein EVAR_6482_1 [Eumeta japonica]